MSSYYNNHPQGASIMSPELERAQTRLQQSERNYSQTQSELMQAMKNRPKTPIEVSARNEEIAQLQERLRRTENEMNKLKELVEKQKQTIKFQSDQIAHPKQHYPTPTTNRYGSNQYGQGDMQLPPPPPPIFSNGAPTSTPHSQPGSVRPSAHPPHQRQNSSPFGPPRNQQPVRQHHGSQNQLTPFRQPQNVDDFGSPEALTRSFASMGVVNTPMGSSDRSNPTSASSGRQHTRGAPSTNSQRLPTPVFNPANGMALIRAPDMRSAVPTLSALDLAKKFGEVLHKAEMFAYNHVNTPSTHKDGELPDDVKKLLLSAASDNTAFRFMSTPYTRYKLVSKIIIQFINRTILRPDAFAGFDTEADAVIQSHRSVMYGSTPAPVKYQMLMAITNLLRGMKARPDFMAHVHNKADERGKQLIKVIEKMMYQKNPSAWEDMFNLMLNAHELAEMMYSVTAEYKFEFPKIGDRFRADYMEPRDPFPNIHSPEELQKRGATVKLGVTPHITFRTSTAAGPGHEVQLLKAFVLVEATKP